MLTCEDWRRLPSPAVAPLIASEATRWHGRLGWDMSDWAAIETARASGALPGFVTRDRSGCVTGWTFFLRHQGDVQIGALVGPSDAAAAMLDAIVSSEIGAGAPSQLLFALAPDEAYDGVLESRGFRIERYRYLAGRPSFEAVRREAGDSFRPLRPQDRATLIELLVGAYRESRELRPFAPGNRPEEWAPYAEQLFAGSCGRFLPSASWLAIDGVTGRASGAVMTTRIGPSIAHIAQVAVAPDARGRGLGRRLVIRAWNDARAEGARDLSLLVAASNRPAAALYARLGLSERAAFVMARRGDG